MMTLKGIQALLEKNEIKAYFNLEYVEFLKFLPLYLELPEQAEYIDNLIQTFNINYHYHKFESAFFNLHILYMIIIYSYILKLKNKNLEDFYMNLIRLDKHEVKKYQKKFKNKKIRLFDFSIFKEKNVFCFFKSLGISDKDLESLSQSVDERNIYAHPRGRILIKDSNELNVLIQKNIEALEKIHSKMNTKVCSLFISFIDENIGDFEEELREIDKLKTELEMEKDDKKIENIKLYINKMNKIFGEKFRDLFIQKNYLNQMDVLDCLNIEIDIYCGKLSRFDDKKKLFIKFKEIFSEEN